MWRVNKVKYGASNPEVQLFVADLSTGSSKMVKPHQLPAEKPP
jgi:hypothetical protein